MALSVSFILHGAILLQNSEAAAGIM